MIPDDELLTLEEIRACGFCIDGARTWFKGRDMDFKGFIKRRGIRYGDVKHLVETDAVVQKVVAKHLENKK